jgi:uncharacterized membrane protein HdeD (DUF308 family)
MMKGASAMQPTAINLLGAQIASLTKKWWVFLVQGLVMIGLAILAFTQPATLIRFIGAYALIDGALKMISGLGPQPANQSRWPALIIGGLSVIVGAVIWVNPQLAGQVVTYVIAAWAVVVGVLLVLWGLRLRQAISGEWLLITLGILSLLFGILVFGNVEAGYLSLQLIFAIYMVAGGILAILLAFRVRGVGVRIGAVG